MRIKVDDFLADELDMMLSVLDARYGKRIKVGFSNRGLRGKKAQLSYYNPFCLPN